MKITVDRIEGAFIVAELPGGETVNLPLALLPDAAEGDVYSVDKDTAEAEARKKRISEKMARVFGD